jgi:hypothetical protein
VTATVASLIGAIVIAAAAASTIPGTLNPTKLPQLPSQGLIVESAHGVLLETTAGRTIGELKGFLIGPPQGHGAPSSTSTFKSQLAIDALVAADPRVTVLFDNHGNGWLFDAVRQKLSRLTQFEAPLANEADIRIIVDGHPSTGWGTKTLIERRGRKLLEGLSVAVIANRYAITTYALGGRPTRVLDLVTGRQVTLAGGCVAVGVLDGGDIVATCTPLYTSQSAKVELFRRDGSKKVLATFPAEAEPEGAWLSPDQKWLLVYLAPNCGDGWTVLLPTAGGDARFVTGEGTVDHPSSQPPFSFGLGWTLEGKIVATVSAKKKSGCEGAPTTGTYLIDPRTLARTRVSTTEASALWGSNA